MIEESGLQLRIGKAAGWAIFNLAILCLYGIFVYVLIVVEGSKTQFPVITAVFTLGAGGGWQSFTLASIPADLRHWFMHYSPVLQYKILAGDYSKCFI